jgi:hypothetical protein
MSDDAPRRGASFSSAFSIILSLARERIAELGCPPVGENPKAFVDRGGLYRRGIRNRVARRPFVDSPPASELVGNAETMLARSAVSSASERDLIAATSHNS